MGQIHIVVMDLPVPRRATDNDDSGSGAARGVRLLQDCHEPFNQYKPAEVADREICFDTIGGQREAAAHDAGTKRQVVQARAAGPDISGEAIDFSNQTQIGTQEMDIIMPRFSSQFVFCPFAFIGIAANDDDACSSRR